MITATRRLRRVASSALGALLLACGTEPNPDVTGAWSVTASYGGGGFACTVVGVQTTPLFCQCTYTEMTGTWEAQRTGLSQGAGIYL